MPAAPSSPPELARLWWGMACMLSDSQQVAALRLLGLSGLWPVAADEHRAMWREKPPAFAGAMLAGLYATLNGRAPLQVMAASMDPISSTARANRLRLTGRAEAQPDQ